MASLKLGGRPTLDWTPSRNRKLTRIWILTDIPLEEIKIVLEELSNGAFTPSTRSISTQIGQLLPNNGKDWRQNRPKRTSQMLNRLSQLKTSRKIRENKHTDHKRDQEGASSTIKDNSCDQQASNVASSHETILGNSFIVGNPGYINWSDHEAFNHHGGRFHAHDSSVPSDLLSRSSSLYQTASLPTTSPRSCSDLEANSFAQIPLPKRGRLRLDRLRAASRLKRSMLPGFYASKTSVSSRLSLSLSYVESVISTDSWRSSIVGGMSLASCNSQIRLTRDESIAWDELIDESKVDLSDQQLVRPSDYEAISLLQRKCCKFSIMGVLNYSTCQKCKFSKDHHLARSSSSCIGDETLLDQFGNTPLHHAAANGNFCQLLDLQTRLHGKVYPVNTSGETFIHVLAIARKMKFYKFLHIVRVAANAGFDFSIRDHHGVTAACRLQQTVLSWSLGPDELYVLDKLYEMVQKPHLADTNVGSSEDVELSYDDTLASDNTQPTKILRNWVSNTQSLSCFTHAVKNSNIHIRDSRGYTLLAIAVGLGNRQASIILLDHGANPNTRSYHGTSILEYAAIRLAQARRNGKDSLYAQILSCIALIADVGGKAKVNVFDEYSVRSTLETRTSPISSEIYATTKDRTQGDLRLDNNAAHRCGKPFAAATTTESKISPSPRSRSMGTKERAFMDWVVNTRSLARSLSGQEKRTCPMIGCEMKFDLLDNMLHHLVSCPSLPKLYYRCSDSKRAELIGYCKSAECRPLRKVKQHRLAKVVQSIDRPLLPMIKPVLENCSQSSSSQRSLLRSDEETSMETDFGERQDINASYEETSTFYSSSLLNSVSLELREKARSFGLNENSQSTEHTSIQEEPTYPSRAQFEFGDYENPNTNPTTGQLWGSCWSQGGADYLRYSESPLNDGRQHCEASSQLEKDLADQANNFTYDTHGGSVSHLPYESQHNASLQEMAFETKDQDHINSANPALIADIMNGYGLQHFVPFNPTVGATQATSYITSETLPLELFQTIPFTFRCDCGYESLLANNTNSYLDFKQHTEICEYYLQDLPVGKQHVCDFQSCGRRYGNRDRLHVHQWEAHTEAMLFLRVSDYQGPMKQIRSVA